MLLKNVVFVLLLAICSFVVMGCQSLPQTESALDNYSELSDRDAVLNSTEANSIVKKAPVEPLEQSISVSVTKERPIEVVQTPQIEIAEQAPLANIWDRVIAGLALNVPDNRRVRLQREWYAKHQSYLNRVIDRAEPFLYLIVEQIEKHNLPMELVLLPIVESAFDPFAYSHGRASGMWQFIPGTGQRFGLQQNWWYDGRRDVYASTQAAIAYLKYLNKHFDGDWLHALAAYNSGEGNVARAIRNNKKRGKKTDFWNLRLPKETKAYVPKLLALSDLLKRDEQFALDWRPVANEQVLSKVAIGSQLDLALAAELAEMSVEEIYRLNPGFNRWSTPPKGPHYLLLPLAKAERFNQQLSQTPKDERVRWLRYSIKNGDALSTIASKFGTTVSTLRSVNKINGSSIRAGKTLLIPTASQSMHSYTLSSDKRLENTLDRKRHGVKQMHRVEPGDSFWKISRRYGVHHRALAKWNGMAPTDPLKVGKELVVWTQSDKVQALPVNNVALNQQQSLRKINYRVRRGDSLARISSKFAVTVRDLKRWNNYLSQRKYLQPGDRITLYIDVRAQSGGN